MLGCAKQATAWGYSPNYEQASQMQQTDPEEQVKVANLDQLTI